MTLERLHTDYGDYLLTCLCLYSIPEEDCEDARQDLYLKLLKTRCHIQDTNIKGFCSTIARHYAANWHRDNTVKSAAGVDVDFESAAPEVDRMDFLRWESIMDNTTMERAADAMAFAKVYTFSGVDNQVLAYDLITDLLLGLTHEQIGQKYGVSRQTISRWLNQWYGWIQTVLPPVENRLR